MDNQEFKTAYGVGNIYAYASEERRCHTGKAPTIRDAITAHGLPVVAEVIDQHVHNFATFTSASVKFSTQQRTQLAFVIATQFGELKITELILFFVKAQSGQFGKFYNVLDPLDITCKLQEWRAECRRIRAAHAAHLQELEREREWQRQDEERIRYQNELRQWWTNRQKVFGLKTK